jgi:hypothetical protein
MFMLDKEKGNVTYETLTTYPITLFHTPEERNMNLPDLCFETTIALFYVFRTMHVLTSTYHPTYARRDALFMIYSVPLRRNNYRLTYLMFC